MEQLSPSGPVPQPSWSLDIIPTKVACTLSQGSNVTSMDFHPCHTLLLVGSANGEFTIWEIGTRERLVSEPFQIWNMQACSAQFQVTNYICNLLLLLLLVVLYLVCKHLHGLILYMWLTNYFL
uniref:Uncharacterized protein n=1 Tax=Triticum urartu TaxID=4572 RepID=A0A8R7QN98_TRIUA